MIVGIGTDVASIERVGEALARFGERFVNRILTPDERARFHRVNPRAQASHFAKRWAAKEAFSKAIGTGIHPPFNWQSVGVGRDDHGKPLLIANEKMTAHLKTLGVSRMHLSLTDDAGVAVAFVVLEDA